MKREEREAREDRIEWEEMRRVPPCVMVLIGTLAVLLAGKPSIRLATLGSGVTPTQGLCHRYVPDSGGGWERREEGWITRRGWMSTKMRGWKKRPCGPFLPDCYFFAAHIAGCPGSLQIHRNFC